MLRGWDSSDSTQFTTFSELCKKATRLYHFLYQTIKQPSTAQKIKSRFLSHKSLQDLISASPALVFSVCSAPLWLISSYTQPSQFLSTLFLPHDMAPSVLPIMLFFKLFTQLTVSHSSSLDSDISTSEKVSPHPLGISCPLPHTNTRNHPFAHENRNYLMTGNIDFMSFTVSPETRTISDTY